MRIAVLGTGSVGRTLADRVAALGHEVVVGTRDVGETMARTTPDGSGNPPFPAWARAHGDVAVATFADAADGADMVINATNGSAALDVLETVGADALGGTILVDVSNPLDFSQGVPPPLFVSNTDSLAERIQRRFPDARVVKTLNTMNAAVMVDPRAVAGGEHTVFVSGNDPAAKGAVADLLRSMGWSDILDLGDITTARGPEMVLPLWLRVMGALGTPAFQFRIAR